MYLRLIETLIKKKNSHACNIQFSPVATKTQKKKQIMKRIAFEHLQVLVIVAFQETLHSHIRVVLTCNLYVSVAAELQIYGKCGLMDRIVTVPSVQTVAHGLSILCAVFCVDGTSSTVRQPIFPRMATVLQLAYPLICSKQLFI